MEHLITLENISKEKILEILSLAQEIKKFPSNYKNKLDRKTLLMIFAKPSLRTRLSFEVGMTQIGGHAIYYDIKDSPMGKKESIADTAKTASKYVDIIMARLFEHKDMEELASYSNVPVISGLDNEEHPCQILSDIFTLKEKFTKFEGITITYLGDANNNVTHSLLYACSKVGINLIISCPNKKEYLPNNTIFEKAKRFTVRSIIKIETNPYEAVKNADLVYTDSWMSYHIPDEEKEKRILILKPYQVNKELMKKANKNAYFMHCLPALRGYEVTADVIDGKQSIVFEQAENRLHVQKAIILKLLGKIK